MLMRACGLTRRDRAIILATSRRSWKEDEIATALRLTFPEHIPEANSAGNYITDHDGIVEEPADTMTELLYEEARDETEPNEVHAFMTQLGMEVVEEEQAVEILVA